MNRSPATILLFFLLTAVASANAELKSGIFKPPRPAPDFSLRGSDGAELKLTRYRGKVIALAFGYTSCPDVCPITLATLAGVRKKLGTASRDFRVIYVTVDPERDSVEHMRAYLAAFDPTFIGATGTSEQLTEIRKAYGILSTKEPIAGDSKGYYVHHSSYIYLIDRQGSLRAMALYGSPIDDLTADIKTLLSQKFD